MKKPQQAFNAPDFSGQTNILFITQDNPAAMLVTNKGGRQHVGTKQFATPFAALTWSIKQGAMMVYMPKTPSPLHN